MRSGLWVLAGLGGGLGSLLRYLLARWAGQRFAGAFPWGTLTANCIGALLLGALAGYGPPEMWSVLLGTGVMGGLTTFSTWMLETVRLFEEGEHRAAWINMLAPLPIGIVLFAAGMAMGRLLI